MQLPSREAGKCGLARWLCLSLGVIGFECCPLPPRPAPPPCGKPHPSAPDKSQDCFLRGVPPVPDPLAHCTVARWCCIFRFRSSSRIRCVGSTEQVSLMRPGVLVEPPFGVWWPGTPSEKITAVCCTCLCYDRWGQHPREGHGEWSIYHEEDGIGRCALQSHSM